MQLNVRLHGAKHSPLFLWSLVALRARISGIQLIYDSEVHLKLRIIFSYGSQGKFQIHFSIIRVLHGSVVKCSSGHQKSKTNSKTDSLKISVPAPDPNADVDLRYQCLCVTRGATDVQLHGAKHSPLFLQLWWPSGTNLKVQRVRGFSRGFQIFSLKFPGTLR